MKGSVAYRSLITEVAQSKCLSSPGQNIVEPQGSLRLIGGNATSGQLQMYLNGEWAGLCGLLFTSTAASVACRQLRLGTPLNYCTDGW